LTSTDRDRLAFKAYEIEELADIYFFRPAGMVFARAARALGLTPTMVTLVATGFGLAGGLLLARERLALVGFALLIAHSVLDSSDGQLARMTGQTSEFGRVLDGASGYVTHAAVYVAMLAAAFTRHADSGAVLLIVLAAASNVVHAQMYDYHRSTYVSYAIAGVVPDSVQAAASAMPPRGMASSILTLYQSIQRFISGPHRAVEAAIAARAFDGRVAADDQVRYRQNFYWLVRGWNVLGDNTRFYAIGVLAWIGRTDLFPMIVLLPMNAAFVALWLWQAARDRRYLAVQRPVL
jgi:hypothetical protein